MKYIILIIVIVAVLGGAAAVWFVQTRSSDTTCEAGSKDSKCGLVVPDSNSQQSTPSKTEAKPVDTVKKGIKRFTLNAIANSGVTGDGSITLKEQLTSVGVRLVKAPTLPAGEQYEAYIVLKGQPPKLMGQLTPIDSPNEKFLWAGAGTTDWYTAEKIIVTKRKPSEAQPGKTVTEAALPKEGQPVQ